MRGEKRSFVDRSEFVGLQGTGSTQRGAGYATDLEEQLEEVGDRSHRKNTASGMIVGQNCRSPQWNGPEGVIRGGG